MTEIKSPLKAIKAFCLDCCCGSQYEVKQCVSQDCALYPYRLGHNTLLKKREKRVYTDEELEVLRERIKMARQSKQK